ELQLPHTRSFHIDVEDRVMSCLSTICSTRKAFAEHRKPALGLLASGFILNHVPMLCENSVLDSKNVRGDPIDWLAKAGESSLHDDEISVGHNCARLIPECGR